MLYSLVLHGGIDKKGARRTILVEGKWIIGCFLGNRQGWSKPRRFSYANVLRTWTESPTQAEIETAIEACWWRIHEPALKHPEKYRHA